MIRLCCCKGSIIIIANLVILLGVSNQVIGQKSRQNLPSAPPQTGNFYYHDMNNAEIFFDNKVLPKGDEISAYLLFNETIK